MRGESNGTRAVRTDRLGGLIAADVDLVDLVGPDGDPDRLLTSARCRLLKFQRKVVVGRVETSIGPLYVKRYNIYSARVAFGSIGGPSPAVAAFRNATALAARGIATARPVAALEFRWHGLLARSFFLSHEVPAAETANLAWRHILGFADPRARRVARRGFARALGAFFRSLHDGGMYHSDLKDVNILVSGPLSSPRFTLLDLERVRIGPRVSRRQRVKNLMQLGRTLGRLTTGTDRARWLAAYLGDAGRAEKRRFVRRVERAQRVKERIRGRPNPGPRAQVSCTIVCQDEAAQIGQCLDSVAWCDEIIVVDGGSHDGTVEIARRYTDRILKNPWPGYRAQKQFALEASRCEWVLNLDADERVSDELANEIRRALVGVPPDVDGFAIPRLVSYLGRWWYRGGWYPRPVVRLVRREKTTWGGTDPHDRAEVPGRVRRLGEPIFHYTYDDVADHLRTVSRLTGVAASHVPAGRRVGVGRLVFEPAWRFVRSYVLKRGCLEGVPGFFVAATDAFYTFLRWARVWDRERRAC